MAVVLVVLPAALSVAACGSSKQSSTRSGTKMVATSSTSVTSTKTAAPATSTHQAASASTAAPGTTAGRAASTTAVHSKTATSGSSSTPKPPPTNARVPATFKILAGGRVQPPTISAPRFLAVQLTLVSADGRVHHVVLRTIPPYPLTVPAGGRASVRIPGQRAGAYAVDVDGARRGTLVIGVEPGP